MSFGQPNVVLQNHIINMYGKCGSLRDAQMVFDVMPERNAVSWSSLIAGYSQNQQEKTAMTLYLEMLRSGFIPDNYTLGSVIRASTSTGDINLGRQLHTHVAKSTSDSCLVVHNALISMYTKFGQIVDASTIFSRISYKDLTSWGSMISGLSQLGFAIESLHCFKEMLHCGDYIPNEFIFGGTISACSSLLQPEYGRQIHGVCMKSGFGNDVFVGCSLTDMYAKCGFVDSAKAIFGQIECPDIVSWNSIITGLAYHGNACEALSFLSKMRYAGLFPDDITIRSVLCACTSSSVLHTGEQLHCYIIKTGFNYEIPVCNTLLMMYTKCSSLQYVFNIFKEFRDKADLVSWNALLTACLAHYQPEAVFCLFNEMNNHHYQPDHITLSNLLKACAQLTSLETGKQVHSYALKVGLEFDNTVANGLLDLYTKCGVLRSARTLFVCMESTDVVPWSTLIVGYAQSGHGEEALSLFNRMIDLGVSPNEVTFVGVLGACSHIGLVKEGWQFYKTMESRYGVVPTREHCSCLVDMLARAGLLMEAEDFIKQLTFEPDIVVWKTLLSACRTYGDVRIGKWAAENALKIDPSNSSAHVLLCNIYAYEGRWEDFARMKGLMKSSGVRKAPGQSWIEVQNKFHTFSVKDVTHAEATEIYSTLVNLYLQMLDVGRELVQRFPNGIGSSNLKSTPHNFV
uniref:Uncharacterized protein n=1 Tax=Opuntia streptacantha TaxID=393608 RepID=A0A7C8YBM7_OPUST